MGLEGCLCEDEVEFFAERGLKGQISDCELTSRVCWCGSGKDLDGVEFLTFCGWS